jgi:hypothetical protein
MLLYPKPEKRVKKPKRLKARGEKTDAWEMTREELKARFQAAGVTQCELQWKDCFKNNFLSFAHSKKRRYITSQEELEEVLLCCLNCHRILEYSPKMYETVREVIAKRKEPVQV